MKISDICRMNLVESFFRQIGSYVLFMGRVFRRPEKKRMYVNQFFFESEKLIIDSIPLVALISTFMGAVLVIQTANNMTNPFIPKMYVGYMTRESLILEFSSTMVCLILAGKIGSNIASEIGTMRITEQIDAMDIMGVNSAGFLVLPKVLACTLLTPALMLMSVFLGVIGGYLTVYFTDIINLDDFITGIRYALNLFYIFYSAFKTAVFAFFISSIASFYGYYARGGSLGVGKSGTRAIVISSVMVLLFDLILTKLML